MANGENLMHGHAIWAHILFNNVTQLLQNKAHCWIFACLHHPSFCEPTSKWAKFV